jgi:hypothetical protein
LQKVVKKSCHKSLKNMVKKLSKSCQKVVKKLTKSCQKVQNSTNSGGGGVVWGGEIVVPRPSASALLTGRRQQQVLDNIHKCAFMNCPFLPGEQILGTCFANTRHLRCQKDILKYCICPKLVI